MNSESCLICLGSNYDREIHMNAARKALSETFPNIRFGEELETEAIGEGFFSPFSNQLATFQTSLTTNEIRQRLKEIEQDNGRTPQEKSQGIVKIDIDILIHGSRILKPEDLKRDYIQQELERL